MGNEKPDECPVINIMNGHLRELQPDGIKSRFEEFYRQFGLSCKLFI